jgi:hypothetical protein
MTSRTLWNICSKSETILDSSAGWALVKRSKIEQVVGREASVVGSCRCSVDKMPITCKASEGLVTTERRVVQAWALCEREPTLSC